MRIDASTRVMAAPVHARFPYPVCPEFAFTVFPSQLGPTNLDDAGGWETDVVADCVHARPVYVPVNNSVQDEAEYADVGWFNPDFKGLVWQKVSASARLKSHGDLFLTPWVRSTWTRDRARSIFYAFAMSDAGTPDVRHDYDPSASAIHLRVVTFDGAALAHQGMTVRLGASLDGVGEHWSGGPGAWEASYTHPAPEDAKPSCRLRFRVSTKPSGGSVQAAKWYTLIYKQAGNPELWVSDDDSDGRRLQSLNLPGGLNAAFGSPSYGFYGYYGWGEGEDASGQTVDIRVVGGLIRIAHGGHAQPTYVPHLDREDPEAGETLGAPALWLTDLQVIASGVRSISCAMAPTMWEASPPPLETSDQSLGFVPQSVPSAIVRYAHGETGSDRRNAVLGSTVTATPIYNEGGVPSSQARLRVSMDNPVIGTYDGVDYSDRTSLLRAVTVRFPEVVRHQPGVPVELYPEDVQVTELFDPGSLEVRRSATLTFDNFRSIAAHHPGGPDVFWGEWANYVGAIAVEIEARLDYYDYDGAWLGGTDWITLFVGYGNLQSDVGIGEGPYAMHCFDRSVAAQNEEFAVPWQDGYNIYYAAAYTANIGSFHRGTMGDTDLAFRAYVPDSPFEDAGDPSGSAYFLPMGSGGSPLMRPQPGMKPWEWLGRLGKQAGFIRYLDREGFLHFEKYALKSTAQPYRVFKLQEDGPEGVNGVYACGVFEGSVRRDLLSVRNRVTVIGIDAFGPLWNPIVSHRSDDGSLYATNTTIWEPTQGNYIGFLQSLVWIDSQFANLDYSSVAADGVFDVVRAPSVDAPFRTWLQPDLELGHRIGIKDVKSGAFDRFAGRYLEFMVVTLRHRIRLGKAPETHIGCRFVPPDTGAHLPF